MSLVINQPTHCSPNSSNLISIAIEWLKRGDKIAFLTLINIEGAAPYPVGTQMLVNQKGEYRGQITGGCAEVALAEQAMVTIEQGDNVTQRYGLDSIYFDIQLPCGSGIDVYFDVRSELVDYQHIKHSLDKRVSVQQSLSTNKGSFIKSYDPNERLIILGQGPILSSLTQLALASGFEVLVVSQNKNDISALVTLDINACALHIAEKEFIQYCDSFTGLVSLFHEHSYEPKILCAALATKLFYIGALGSRQTHKKRLESLFDLKCSDNDVAKIFGPVGLDIHAETPAQIAVSILAQVIAKKPKQNEQ